MLGTRRLGSWRFQRAVRRSVRKTPAWLIYRKVTAFDAETGESVKPNKQLVKYVRREIQGALVEWPRYGHWDSNVKAWNEESAVDLGQVLRSRAVFWAVLANSATLTVLLTTITKMVEIFSDDFQLRTLLASANLYPILASALGAYVSIHLWRVAEGKIDPGEYFFTRPFYAKTDQWETATIASPREPTTRLEKARHRCQRCLIRAARFLRRLDRIPTAEHRRLRGETAAKAMDNILDNSTGQAMKEVRRQSFPQRNAEFRKASPSDLVRIGNYRRARAIAFSGDSATIAITGRRGVGKSAVMRKLERDHFSHGASVFIGSFSQVRVDELPRQILLDLASKLKVRPTRTSRKPLVYFAVSTILAILLLLFSAFLYSATSESLFDWLRREISAVPDLWLTLSGLCGLVAVLSLAFWFGELIASEVGKQRRWIDLAQQIIDDHQFLVESTAHGTVGVQGKASWEKSVSRRRVPVTDSDVVNDFRDLVQTFTAKRSNHVLVLIDELDQLDDTDSIEAALNRIKPLFNTPGASFVVSASTEALAGFRGRATSELDVLESSLETVLEFLPPGEAESRRILSGRFVGFPPILTRYCYVASGGRPRELLRQAGAAIEMYWAATQTSGHDAVPERTRLAVKAFADRREDGWRNVGGSGRPQGSADATRSLSYRAMAFGISAGYVLEEIDRALHTDEGKGALALMDHLTTTLDSGTLPELIGTRDRRRFPALARLLEVHRLLDRWADAEMTSSAAWRPRESCDVPALARLVGASTVCEADWQHLWTRAESAVRACEAGHPRRSGTAPAS